MLYLQRHLNIRSYRAVWLMGQKIRRAMKQRNALYQTGGTVEVDEIHIGGQQSYKKRRKKPNKTPFLMTVEEAKHGGPRFVSLKELEAVYKEQVLPALEKQVKKGSRIKTDGAGAYTLARGYQQDRSVYHRDKERTQDHLYWINMLTSNLKRFLISTYHGVGRKYREAYLEEFAYRFNRRYWPAQAFDRLLYACVIADPVTLPDVKA